MEDQNSVRTKFMTVAKKNATITEEDDETESKDSAIWKLNFTSEEVADSELLDYSDL